MLVDASSFTTAVLLEINRCVIEDAYWLQPINDEQNNAILKGVNLTAQWSAMELNFFSEPLCMHSVRSGFLLPSL